MDIIYADAFITIVAAAGSSSDYGLPGVGTSMRQPGPLVKFQGKYFTTVRPGQSPAIQGSAWMTSGWTYQEVILSRRRLVFTDEQASLECDSMRYCESLKSNSEKFQRKIRPRAFTRESTSTFKGIGQAPDDICDHIEEYTKRSLTYDPDIINGFLGILSAYEQLEIPVRHLWGAPFIPVTWYWYAHQFSPRTRMLVSGLVWESAGLGSRVGPGLDGRAQQSSSETIRACSITLFFE